MPNKEYFYSLRQIPAIKSMHHECEKEASLTNVNNTTPVVEDPKADEKPTLVGY